MGSYNVACSISNISIGGGDDIAYIPLQINEYPYSIGDGNNNLIYMHCFYSPVTLPVFGVYDDCGGIENIEKDNNVQVIENYFNKEIMKLVNIDNTTKPISSGMFIHREIYNLCIANIVDEFGKKTGLRVTTANELNNKLEKYIISLKDCIKQTNNSIKTLKEIAVKKPDDKELTELIKSFSNRLNEFWNGIFVKHNRFKFGNYQEFNKIYQIEILQGNLKKELIDFVLFEHGMFAVWQPLC